MGQGIAVQGSLGVADHEGVGAGGGGVAGEALGPGAKVQPGPVSACIEWKMLQYVSAA